MTYITPAPTSNQSANIPMDAAGRAQAIDLETDHAAP